MLAGHAGNAGGLQAPFFLRLRCFLESKSCPENEPLAQGLQCQDWRSVLPLTQRPVLSEVRTMSTKSVCLHTGLHQTDQRAHFVPFLGRVPDPQY